MVELQIVVLAVAGSSPVGRPSVTLAPFTLRHECFSCGLSNGNCRSIRMTHSPSSVILSEVAHSCVRIGQGGGAFHNADSVVIVSR